MIEIIPGIYEESLAEIELKVALVAPYVQVVQIDISDGTFVKKPGGNDIAGLKILISRYPDVIFEAHLMVDQPEKYVRVLVAAGFKRLIAHVEANDPRAFLQEIEYESAEVGIAIDAASELEQVEPFLEEVDFVLVMTVEAGASGQAFLPETVEKVKTIHENLPDLPIEVDGGMNQQTAKIVTEAGATRIVTTSFLFTNHANSIAQGIKLLQ